MEEEEEEEEKKRFYICKCCCRLMPVSSLFIHSKTRHKHHRKELGKKRIKIPVLVVLSLLFFFFFSLYHRPECTGQCSAVNGRTDGRTQ